MAKRKRETPYTTEMLNTPVGEAMVKRIVERAIEMAQADYAQLALSLKGTQHISSPLLGLSYDGDIVSEKSTMRHHFEYVISTIRGEEPPHVPSNDVKYLEGLEVLASDYIQKAIDEVTGGAGLPDEPVEPEAVEEKVLNEETEDDG